MKYINLFVAVLILTFSGVGFSVIANAQEIASQSITLELGWNIVSTPKVLDSHSFSVDETSENFDIYLLDASQPTGWATMADLGQSEFMPLYGYFVNNKTGIRQILTFNYDMTVDTVDKLFSRTFSEAGWYSIGVANDGYVKQQDANRDDTNNPSKILSLMEGKYDMVIDFTDYVYASNRKSVALSNPWKAMAPVDVDVLNDFRETKGYALYVKEAGAKYIGFQNDAIVSLPAPTTTSKLVVKTSSNNPDSTTLKVKTSNNSDWYNVFTFDLDSDDSENDISLNSMELTVNLSSSTYDAVVDDAKLIIGGITINDFMVMNGSSAVATLIFNVDSSAIVYSGEKAEVELLLRFKSLSSGDEGISVQGEVTSLNRDAIKTDSEDGIELLGSATGDEHTLRTEGAVIEFVSATETLKLNSDATTTDDSGTFVLKFDVTAFETDLFVNMTAASGTEMGSAGVNYLVTDGSGTVVSVGAPSHSLSSGAETVGTQYRVSEGETQTFTLTVNLDPSTMGFYGVQLYSLNFKSSAGNPDRQQKTLPIENFETDALEI